METIVLLPAAGMTHRMWQWQVAALGDRFTVVTPDLPGHADVPGPFSFERAVAEVGGRIDGAAGPVHLCGLSISATLAVLTCLARPERVRSLVLSGGVAHPPAALALQRAVAAAMPAGLVQRVFGAQLGRAVDPAADGRAEFIAGCAADFRAVGKRVYLDMLRELAHTDLRGRLAQVGVPTLVVCGARDKVNIPGSRELAAGIPGAELRIVPDAGHLWNLEQPELFSRTVAEFADGAAPTGPAPAS